MHRAVPYPVLLLLKSGQFVTLSLAHKRWAQKEMGKVVLDGGIVSASLPDDDALLAEVMQAFMQSLALSSQLVGKTKALLYHRNPATTQLV